MGGPEAKIESYLKDSVEAAGGCCYKIASSGVRGVPDRLIVLNGITALVECKSEKGNLSHHQTKVFNQITKAGGFVFLIDSKERVDDMLLFLLQDEDDGPQIWVPGGLDS